MYTTVLVITLINILFFILHEIDAIRNAEWKIAKLLTPFRGKTKKLIYLYLRLPLPSIVVFYLYSVFALGSLEVFLIVNTLAVLHLAVHVILHHMDTYLFKSTFSFILVVGFAITGLINLFLSPQLFG